MNHRLLYDLCALAGGVPYFAVVGILIHYLVRRARFKYARGRGAALPVFCPSSAALGMVFLLTQTFYRPSIQHVVEARQVMEAEEDDQGEPDTPDQELDQQLRQIRRGEPVKSLILRL